MEKSIKNYFILIFLAIIWGSSFILMKRGLEVYSYTQVAALRLFIAFLSLLPFVVRAFKKVAKKHWLAIVITAFLGNGIPAFLFTKAQTHLDSSFVGILNSLTPLFTLLLGIYFFKSRPTKTNIFGIIIGLSGAFLLSSSNLDGFFTINFYTLLVVLATLFYAVSVNVIRKYLADLDAISISALAFLFIGPACGIYIFRGNFIPLLYSEGGVDALIYIAILAIIGTSLAVVIFNKLIKDSSAIFASSVTYLIPIVAIFWGIWDGEHILLTHIVGATIILCGVYLVNKK
ncbi:MAG: DMT family transporter [Flavobacteriales bacterium]|nr:DMT family transporter [Flavobacteriales bacterium]